MPLDRFDKGIGAAVLDTAQGIFCFLHGILAVGLVSEELNQLFQVRFFFYEGSNALFLLFFQLVCHARLCH